jgi:hypothetical protein
VIEERKNTSMLKVKDPLSFEIWIFRNGQPGYDDDRIIDVNLLSKLSIIFKEWRVMNNVLL